MSSNVEKDVRHVHITSKSKFFDLKLKEVWAYKDLIFLFTKRNFAVRYKQTILGPAWLFISPIFTSVIYTFVFGGIAKMSTDGLPQILFYLSSNAIWSFFALSITSNASTFTGNASIFGKVYFPRLTMPISNIISAIVQFSIQMILVIGTLIYYTIKGAVNPSLWAFLFVPIVLIHLGILGMGCGIIISSLTTKYRDLSILVEFGVSLWMYATPVVYPISQLDNEFLKKIIMINPVTAPIEMFRFALLGEGSINLPYLVISWVITIFVALFGILIFNRVEKTFMDTV